MNKSKLIAVVVAFVLLAAVASSYVQWQLNSDSLANEVKKLAVEQAAPMHGEDLEASIVSRATFSDVKSGREIRRYTVRLSDGAKQSTCLISAEQGTDGKYKLSLIKSDG